MAIQLTDPGLVHDDASDRHTEYLAGTLPVVLVATHDGDLEPSHIPPRSNLRRLERFSTARDRFTAPLAHEISDALERLTGERPHVVINRLSRRVMDPNRDAESASEHPQAAAAYEAFHNVLAEVVRKVQEASPRALLIDIHGQTKHPADVCISTHDGQTLRPLQMQHAASDAWLEVQVGRELVSAGFAVPGLVHQIDTDWIGKRRESSFQTVAVPAELPLGMQQGGWLIRHYSQGPEAVASMQIEVHRRIRYQPELRGRFAREFAGILDRFISKSAAGR